MPTTKFFGGAADLMKCFDQISRPLAKYILQLAGLPSIIIEPYFNMLDNLTIYNSFNQHLGQPHHHPAGIPQGCPMSMMVLTLLLRPWLIDMKQRELHPRTLADDVLLLANSQAHAPPHLHHSTRFIEGFQQTLIFFADLGARISPHKSLTFSSDTLM